MRPDLRLLCRHIKTRRAIDAVAVEQGHGWHIQVGTRGNQVLRQGGAFEKAESRAGMEFNEHRPGGGRLHSLFVRLIMEMMMQDVKGGQLRAENQKLTTGFRNRELLSKPVVSFELSVLS